MGWGRAAVVAGLVALMALVGGLGGAARAQDGTPAAACVETTPEENKALVEAYFAEAYNARNPEAAARFLSEGFARTNPARPQANEPGTADDVERVIENLEDFPDIQITIEEIIAEGDKVAAVMTWNGTHSDVIDQWNAPATGNPTSFAFMAMYRVECGLLAEQTVVLDYFSMVREVGLVTDDELATIGSAALAATPAPATEASPTPAPAATEAAQTRPERPRVFIGSSVEGLAVAEALEFDLQFFADVTLWDQGVFHLSQGTLAALQQAADTSDFAILVLTADDVTTRRGQTYLTARDNVIFELGFFMGHLGPERTFIVYSRDNSPTLPSDLAGITVATFADRADGNMDAAVGPAAIQLRNAMQAVMAAEER